MYFSRVLCVIIVSVAVACVNANCPYQGKIEKIEPCDNKQTKLFTIQKPYEVVMSGDNCDVSITGCVIMNQDVRSVKCKWTAWKDNVQISKGERPACGFKLGTIEAKCPLKKGSSMCAKREIVKNPVGRAGTTIALGHLKMRFECTTSDGRSQCLIGEGKLFKK